MIEDVIVLQGGVTVTREAVHLAIDLESRGVRLRIENGGLVASPAALVTADEARQLKTHVRSLKRLVAYCDRPEARQ